MRYIVGTEFLLSVTRSSRKKTILKTEQDLNVKTNYLCVERYNRKKNGFTKLHEIYSWSGISNIYYWK